MESELQENNQNSVSAKSLRKEFLLIASAAASTRSDRCAAGIL